MLQLAHSCASTLLLLASPCHFLPQQCQRPCLHLRHHGPLPRLHLRAYATAGITPQFSAAAVPVALPPPAAPQPPATAASKGLCYCWHHPAMFCRSSASGPASTCCCTMGHCRNHGCTKLLMLLLALLCHLLPQQRQRPCPHLPNHCILPRLQRLAPYSSIT